ncbi:acyltransferase [Shewanella baltica]|uniref:acyltransferase n=1 Tax=Shewanella baltica TaxID=62322 RepID=UPI003D7ACD10
MKHKFCLLYTWFVRTFLILLPDQPLIMRFRGWCYSQVMPQCGRDFQVSASTLLRNLENISVGNHVYLAPNVIINAIAMVKLGNEVMVGFNSVIVSGNHTRIEMSYRFGKSKVNDILIGSGTWVAANCTVIAGAIIGDGCLVAANSAISGDCSSHGIYAGVPARKIK